MKCLGLSVDIYDLIFVHFHELLSPFSYFIMPIAIATSHLVILSQVSVLPLTPPLFLSNVLFLIQRSKHIACASLPGPQILWYHSKSLVDNICVDTLDSSLTLLGIVQGYPKHAILLNLVHICDQLAISGLL